MTAVRRWFARLSIHRKLLVIAILVSSVALTVAMVGLSVIDLWRYRQAAQEDVQALAQIVAEQAWAAAAFEDAVDADETLRAIRVRQEVEQACLFLLNGRLLAGFANDGVCDPIRPADTSWARVSGVAQVERNGQPYGHVHVERRLPDLRRRFLLTLASGLVVLALGGMVAFLLAGRLSTAVSAPIRSLAENARRFGHDPTGDWADVPMPPDELGELSRAFREMAQRVRGASTQLQETNDALRHENEERRRVEQERAEALAREREASRLKDEFLAAVSHEVRTPLNAIAGWAQVLGSPGTDAPTRDRAIAAIMRNVHAQTNVINDLIDISRSFTGKLRLNLARLDLCAVIRAGVEAIQPTAHARNVSLVTHLPSQPCQVSGDRDRLQQILWNLLSNAVRFTPAGGTVTVAIARSADAVSLTVTDTGVGIAPEFLPHVFERFRQADGSMTREYGGLGLGLSIARDLTELHGGTLRAASAGRGQGAEFTVTLPALPQSAIDTPLPTPAGGLPSVAGVHVLVVDDNDDARAVIETTLAQAGAVVRLAASGEDAVSAWTASPADVLICDLAMPHVSGFDVLSQLRVVDGRAGREIRAIAVTAHASEEVHQKCAEAGFDHHLAKPFSSAELIMAVAAAASVPVGNLKEPL